MPFNTILSATKISPGNSDTFDFPSITTLSDGSFAVTYEVIDHIESSQIVSEVFNAQGQLVQETFATPLPHFGQFDPHLDGLSGGGYALAWTEMVLVNGIGVIEGFTAVYDNQGNPLSTPANLYGDQQISLPHVTALSGGGYAVAWIVADGGGAGDIVAAVYDAAGQEVVAPINLTNSPGVDDRINFLTTSAAGLANGGFAVTFASGDIDAGYDVYTAIYDAAAQPVLSPLNITQSAAINENSPQIAVLSNGNYALSWDGIIDTPSFQLFTYTAVFDAQGNEIAAPSVVGAGQINRIGALTNGNYAVMWFDGLDVFTAVYDGQGLQVVAPVHVDSAPGAFTNVAGAVTALANGNFALTWHAQIADGSFDILTAVYSATGDELVAPVVVGNTPEALGGFEITDAHATANNSYAITWQGAGSGSIEPAEYLSIVQFVDSVNVVGSPDIAIDLSDVTAIGGDVTVTDNGNAVTIDLSHLISVGGNFALSHNGAVLTITLPSLVSVSGDLTIDGNASASVVNIGGVASVGGDLDISRNTSAGDLDIADLLNVGGDLTIDGDTSATAIALGGLTGVSGDLGIHGNIAAITIDLSALTSAGALVISNNGVVTLDLGALVSVGGAVSVTGNDSLLTVDMPNLTDVGGDLTVKGNDAATAVSFRHLASVGGGMTVAMGDGSLRTIDAGGLHTVGGGIAVSIADGSSNTINFGGVHTVHGGIVVSMGDGSSNTINFGSLDDVDGDVTIDAAKDAAAVDASGLGSGGGDLLLTGGTVDTTVALGGLDNMTGELTVTGAGGVRVQASAGLNKLDLRGTADNDDVTGSDSVRNVMDGRGGGDQLTGGDAKDTIQGGSGDDTLSGGDAWDVLRGGDGDDVMTGGSGHDGLFGGQGADIFRYLLLSDSGVGGANHDLIHDFTPGEDHIDLSALDADTATLSDDAFTFIGTDAFHHQAGELRQLTTQSGNTLIRADVDGDGHADFEAAMTGVIVLQASDFVL